MLPVRDCDRSCGSATANAKTTNITVPAEACPYLLRERTPREPRPLVKAESAPYLSLITLAREVRNGVGAEGPKTVPAAMLHKRRVGRRVKPRHDPGHQPRDRRDTGHGAADGSRGDPPGDQGGRQGAPGLARQDRQGARAAAAQ